MTQRDRQQVHGRPASVTYDHEPSSGGAGRADRCRERLLALERGRTLAMIGRCRIKGSRPGVNTILYAAELH